MKKIFSLIMILLGLSLTAYSQNTGRITGVIRDKETGDGIIGANVIIEGTRYGAATDVDGKYSINNVPPGEYNLIASMISYQKVVIKNIVVKNNVTLKQDITLSSTAIEIGEVVVTAEKPLIQKDLTSTSSVVTASELKAMPVENLGQVINLQAGVVGGHFRGGRANEVSYMIDGVPVNDAFNNTKGIEIENNVIRQLEVISGTFNAEYGQAMSGVVNIITKNGSPKFESSFSGSVGNYYSSESKVFRNLDNPVYPHSRDIQGSLSGPIPMVKDLTFFTNARYYYDEGYFYGKRDFNIEDALNPVFNSINSTYQQLLDSRTGDGSWVAMSPYEKFSLQGKLTYTQPDYNLSYSVFYDNNWNQYYDHARIFSPDGRLNHYRYNTIQSLQYTYIQSANTFQTLKLSYNKNEAEGYLYKDPNDSRYVATDKGAPTTQFLFNHGGNDGSRYGRSTRTGIIQWTLTSQLNNHHKLGMGIEGKFYNVKNGAKNLETNRIQTAPHPDSFYVFLSYPAEHSRGNQSYNKSPYEGSFYIQDKMEYDILIVNLGLRFEAFNPNDQLLKDKQRPVSEEYKWATVKYQLSPRLGLSFPITDQGAIHFSYGHFLQLPSFENLYFNDENKYTQNSLSVVSGNEDLKPQKTVMYELGLQQVFLDNISVDMSIYYRDIRGLLGVEFVKPTTGETLEYARYINTDYGNVKGFVISVDRGKVNNFSYKVDYTYQVAEGSSSDPLYAFNLKSSGKDPERKITPLSWDQRSTLNVSANYSTENKWNFGFIFGYGSGLPYTEAAKITDGLSFTNQGTMPPTYNFDMRVEKIFEISGYFLNSYAIIYNVFNIMNETGVYSTTGRANADTDIELNVNNGLYSREMGDLQLNNPGRYSAPRTIKIGVGINF